MPTIIPTTRSQRVALRIRQGFLVLTAAIMAVATLAFLWLIGDVTLTGHL